MNLLITTQKVDNNDGVLGFFHDWIAEFAKHCEQVTVVCLFVGEHQLPGNVKVLSLGKETGENKLKYFFNFYRYIWRERSNYDAVFVHMNPEYVVLGGLFWKIMKKKIGLWYAHGSVNWILRLAEKLVDYVFTASEESFRIGSDKKNVMGHGIDLQKFIGGRKEIKECFSLVTVGRISPIKKYETIIEAVRVLKEQKRVDVKLKIIGGAIDILGQKYLEELKKVVDSQGLVEAVEFIGEVSNKDLAKYLGGDVFVHSSGTGSLDKAMLEAMAYGLIVISSNDAAKNILRDDRLLFDGSSENLVEKIKAIHGLTIDQREEISLKLRREVRVNHNLRDLIKNIYNLYEC